MEIRPFKAYRFNPDLVGNPADCIAPPYDIIDEDQQGQLHDKNPCNIVRIIKGKTEPTDSDSNNQYTRAANCLDTWIAKENLKQDDQDTIYAYIQDYNIGQTAYRRFSFIALAKLEEFGKIVRPHEQTLSKPKTDRLNLQLATSAQFGLVFMLYDDPENIADSILEKTAETNPLVEHTDDLGVVHRLYPITDQADIEAIEKMMADKSVVIADGHHRYETGLAYMKMKPENPNAKYQMLAFANMSHPGLLVLATHRLINNLENFDPSEFAEKLAQNFEVKQFPYSSDQEKASAKENMLAEMDHNFQQGKSAFGIYSADKVFRLAVLRDFAVMETLAPEKSKPWQKLDVAVLHKLIIESILDLDEEKVAGGEYLQYVKDTPNAIDDSIAKVDAGKKQIAVFMNPPKLEQIKAVADNSEKMPQKSTYFYPKVFTGFTINKL